MAAEAPSRAATSAAAPPSARGWPAGGRSVVPGAHGAVRKPQAGCLGNRSAGRHPPTGPVEVWRAPVAG